MIPVSSVMSRAVVSVDQSTPIRQAAALMERYDVGALPVLDGPRVVGMVTDRDLAVRALAAGQAPDTPVGEVATAAVEWCYEDEDLDAVQQRMADAQVRRLPVVNRVGELTGTLSLGDLATRCDGDARAKIASTLEDISQQRIAAGLQA